MATTRITRLRNAIAPRLPSVPVEYDRQYQEQLLNTLRLYFNQLDSNLASLLDSQGGQYLGFPFGSFHQDGTTYLTAAMTNVSTADIQVISTADFVNSAGTILIVDELISYTGKTPTSFTGITRGVYGSTKDAHSIGDITTEAQGVVSSSTALPIVMSQTDASNGVSLSPTNRARITFDVAGYYNVQFSAQLLNYTTDNDNVSFWYRQNGVDVPFSAGVQQVLPKHGTFPGACIVAWNIILPVEASDYIELYYASNTGNTVLCTHAPGTVLVAPPVTPTSPAVILTATFVSALTA